MGGRWYMPVIGLLALVVMGLMLIPLQHGQSLAGDRIFTGAGTDTWDHGFYMGVMQQGASGAWRTVNLATTEPTNRNLTHLFLVSSGHLGAALGLEMPAMYHLARLAVGVAFLVWLGWQLRRWLSERLALLAFLFVAFSAGLGWMEFGWNVLSTDLWLSETNTFMTLYFWPHITWSLLLRCVATVALFYGLQSHSVRWGLLAAACCALLAFDHPFELVGIAITTAVYLGVLAWVARREGRPFDWNPALSYLTANAAALPFVLYMYLQVRADPLLSHKLTMGTEPVPGVLALLSGLGLLVPLSLLPALFAWKPAPSDRLFEPPLRREVMVFLYVWAGSTGGMMYLLQSQFIARKLILGVHVPLAILASVGLIQLIRRLGPTLSTGTKAVAALAVVALSSPTLVVNLREEMANYDRGTAMNCRFYLSRDEVEGLRALAQGLPKDTMVQPVPGVLQPKSHDPTTKFRGPYLPDITLIVYGPWLTERPLAVSHPWETPGFDAKFERLMMWADEHGTEPIVRPNGNYWPAQ